MLAIDDDAPERDETDDALEPTVDWRGAFMYEASVSGSAA
jgi:hypothetical protein